MGRAVNTPGRLSIFDNSRTVYYSAISEGGYWVSDIPVTTGAGQLKVVSTGLVGKETIFHQPYYVSSDLLLPGLKTFIFAAEWDRLALDGQSIDYRPLLFVVAFAGGLTE